jgi:SAM-dependent methyltransferase
LIDKTDGKLVADINHPLASYPIKFAARYVEELAPIEEHGGACNDIAELVTQSGPGMQAPSLHGKETDFFSVYPFKRNNECDDELFYKEPRLIYHLDTAALKQVSAIYARLLQPGSKILDLMSSHVSHIPQSLDSYQAIGLGMNEKELSSNPQLSSYKVQNLNRVPILPFENNQFDAVICTASIEYLMRPIEVVKEVARVTRNGGLFITTFSDRWFPGKEIQPWSEMHPFERMGLVSEYYRKSGWFDHLNTESIRGLPRPLDDPHINQRNSSDPVFAIWGQVVK